MRKEINHSESCSDEAKNNVAEPGPCKADIPDVGFPIDGVRCDGCWEELPFNCWCDSFRYCAQCVGGGGVCGLWAEPGECKADVVDENFAETGGGEDGAVDEDAGEVKWIW